MPKRGELVVRKGEFPTMTDRLRDRLIGLSVENENLDDELCQAAEDMLNMKRQVIQQFRRQVAAQAQMLAENFHEDEEQEDDAGGNEEEPEAPKETNPELDEAGRVLRSEKTSSGESNRSAPAHKRDALSRPGKGQTSVVFRPMHSGKR